jgi:hypothetical protein
MIRRYVTVFMSLRLPPRLHNLVPDMLVPQVCIENVLSGETSFAVGANLLAFFGMVYLVMSAQASSPMFVFSVTFGASIRCRRAIQGVVFSSGRIL